MDTKLNNIKQSQELSVRKFYENFKELTELELLAGGDGFDRIILEPSLNRPALAITGYFKNFASKRIQLFGAGEMAYMKQTVSASELEDFDEMFTTEEANMGIQEIFTGDFLTVETAMRTAIAELMEEDTFSDLPISLGSIEDLVITKKATEKDGKQTFKVTAELPSEVEGEELSITFGIVVKGEVLDSLLMSMNGKGTMDGVTMSYDVDVKQQIEAKGRTEAKYASVPQNVTWIEE